MDEPCVIHTNTYIACSHTVIQVTLRGESANDFPRQVGLDQLQWVGKWVCCEPATCHRNAVSKTSKGHGNPRTELPMKSCYLASTFSFIHWLTDCLIHCIDQFIDWYLIWFTWTPQKWKKHEKLVATSLTFLWIVGTQWVQLDRDEVCLFLIAFLERHPHFPAQVEYPVTQSHAVPL